MTVAAQAHPGRYLGATRALVGSGDIPFVAPSNTGGASAKTASFRGGSTVAPFLNFSPFTRGSSLLDPEKAFCSQGGASSPKRVLQCYP